MGRTRASATEGLTCARLVRGLNVGQVLRLLHVGGAEVKGIRLYDRDLS